MKKVEAILEPFDVEEVKKNLEGIGVRSMTVTEVRGFGRPSGRTEVYRGIKFDPPFAAEAKIEIVVIDEMAAAAVAAIRKKAKTDESGQGDIRVISLDDAVRLAAAKKSAAAV